MSVFALSMVLKLYCVSGTLVWILPGYSAIIVLPTIVLEQVQNWFRPWNVTSLQPSIHGLLGGELCLKGWFVTG
jgi:hypothetical protein